MVWDTLKIAEWPAAQLEADCGDTALGIARRMLDDAVQTGGMASEQLWTDAHVNLAQRTALDPDARFAT